MSVYGPGRKLTLTHFWYRTFAAQFGLPAVLQVIHAWPSLDVDLDGKEQLMPAFLSLMQLFVYLQADLLDCMSLIPLERQKLVTYQAALRVKSRDQAPNETQRIDLFVTRQWVRILLWEHTARHFAMACNPEDPAFSLFLPVQIGHEMLSVLSSATDTAVKAHGFNVELKVFKLADAMLDIVACVPSSARGDGMLVGTGDILLSLQSVLCQVGGRESTLVDKMQLRMTQLELTTGSWPYSTLIPTSSSTEGGRPRVIRSSLEELNFDGPRVEEIIER